MHIHVGNSDRQAMRDFALQVEAGLLHSRGLEVVRKRGNIRLLELRQARRQLAIRGTHRTVHQRVGILGENLVIEEIIVVQEQEISCQPVVALNRGGVDLRNASVEQAIPGANHQRPIIPDRVCQSHARRVVGGVVRHPAGVRPQRI